MSIESWTEVEYSYDANKVRRLCNPNKEFPSSEEMATISLKAPNEVWYKAGAKYLWGNSVTGEKTRFYLPKTSPNGKDFDSYMLDQLAQFSQQLGVEELPEEVPTEKLLEWLKPYVHISKVIPEKCWNPKDLDNTYNNPSSRERNPVQRFSYSLKNPDLKGETILEGEILLRAPEEIWLSLGSSSTPWGVFPSEISPDGSESYKDFINRKLQQLYDKEGSLPDEVPEAIFVEWVTNKPTESKTTPYTENNIHAQERREWVLKHGSERLKLALDLNLLDQSHGVYLDEKLGLEYPEWESFPHKRDRKAWGFKEIINPSLEDLKTLKDVRDTLDPKAKLCWFDTPYPESGKKVPGKSALLARILGREMFKTL